MSDNIVENKNTVKDTGTDKKNPANQGVQKKGFSVNFTISIVLLVIFAGSIIFLNSKIDGISKKLDSLSANYIARDQLFEKKIQALENNFSELSAQYHELRKSISALGNREPDSNEDWALSEIEYLLIIATHRLQLEHDIDTALSAMEAALQRIEALDDPDLLPVREQFISDINNLKAVNRADITGLSIYLADLVEKANKLPLSKTVSGTPESSTRIVIQENNDSEAGSMLKAIWQEIKSLLVIKKSGEVKQELLLPDQEYFLYQNLRLELASARTSVLIRDTENFRTSITLIKDWLNQYFDNNDSAVINILDTLEKMSEVNLNPELPDVNSSLETLRAYLHSKETAQIFRSSGQIKLNI